MHPSRLRSAVQRGFTLVELLIVVIILAILAAIVIPQFSSATDDTKEAALDSNLAALRNAIELYKAQHGSYPGDVASNTGCATKGTGAADSGQAFIDHLLMYSDASGNTCAAGDTTYKYGPYLRKAVPSEPYNSLGNAAAGILVTTTGTIAVTNAGGWAYDTLSGQILANLTKTDAKGVALSTH